MNQVAEKTSQSLPEAESVQLRKAYSISQLKILPLLFLLWMLAWVDRSNVAFAKLQMLSDLKFSETVYGLGAGLFFVGYVIFGIPTSLIQKRFGPRRVLSGVAVCWGLTSIAMMFVHTIWQFYVLRLFLGMFEAGFYPGVILYFNEWFAGKRRARNFSIFHSGAVCSTVAVGLTGGLVLQGMNGVAGFEGWRWMFFAQAVPTVAFALLSYFVLPDGPEVAKWLTPRQRELIREDLRRTPELVESTGEQRGPLLSNSSVWLLSAMYFCIMSATTALVFFVPTILHEAGFVGFRSVGLAVAGTSFLGAALNITISTLGGEARRRKIFCTAAAFLAATSLLATIYAWRVSPAMTFTLIALGLGASGAAITLFWQLSVGLLDKRDTVVAVPLISSIANVAGFVTPSIIGYLRDLTGSYVSGFIFTACVQGIGVAFIFLGVQFIEKKHLRDRDRSFAKPA